ncbi:MAG: hypothetical protein IIA88_11480, partial [Bacteroidetes bacterium]|nr:hypothetical protein [Bacteroidota bacterium]
MRTILTIWIFTLLACTTSTQEISEHQNKSDLPDNTTPHQDSITFAEPIEPKSDSVDFGKYGIRLTGDSLDYKTMKHEIAKAREKLRILFESGKIDLDSVRNFFTESLLNGIIPYWYGTKWDFDGYTATPKNGKIACGYFVSTTLQHIGLNLNRYRFAQQTPINEAKTLCLNDSVITFSDSTANLISAVRKEFEKGIYFVGLESNHVGFLLKRNEEVFFIHSNYLGPQEVVIERAINSEVLLYYTAFYLAEITVNDNLMRKWLNGDEVEVILDD